jgi:hypothetical protein
VPDLPKPTITPFTHQNALMNHTQSASAHFKCAANYYQHACYPQAIQHYLAGLEVDSTHTEIYADLAKAYEMAGCWARALACLERVLRTAPDSATALRRQDRIREEQKTYQALIDDIGLNFDPPQAFLLQSENKTIKRKYFRLTYDETIPPKALWVICQLIKRTYHEVGSLFRYCPRQVVSIAIEDVSQLSPSANRSLPQWASASYDGQIWLNYCAYGAPDFGILLALIRHEWVHFVVDTIAKRQCPVWLNEGLAQIIARPMMSHERQHLRRANQKNQLQPFHTLDKPFAQIAPDRRRLAYLQSTAIAETLIQQFGISQIRKLLHQIGGGMQPEMAIWKTFGKTMVEITAAWKVKLMRSDAGCQSPIDNGEFRNAQPAQHNNHGKTRYCYHHPRWFRWIQLLSRRFHP